MIRFATVTIEGTTHHVSEPLPPEVAIQLTELEAFQAFKAADKYGDVIDAAIEAAANTRRAKTPRRPARQSVAGSSPLATNTVGPGHIATQLPLAVRRDLRDRIRRAKAVLRSHGVRPGLWKQLVPLVRWIPSGCYIEIAKEMEQALSVQLGERFERLPVPIRAPKPKDLKRETERLVVEGVVRDIAESTAHVVLAKRAMEAQQRPAQFERETATWEAETSIAIATAAMRDPSPQALSSARAYFEKLDEAVSYDTVRRKHRNAT